MPKKRKSKGKIVPAPVSIYRDLKDKEENKKKINQNIFENNTKKTKLKKVPKGSHRMPDGSIMKDKDMKNKKSYY